MSQKKRKGQTGRQRRKQKTKELLRDVQNGIPLDELYPEEEDMIEKTVTPKSLEELTDQFDASEDIISEMAVELKEPDADVVPEIEEKEAESIEEEELPDLETTVKDIIGFEQEEIVKDDFDFDLINAEILHSMIPVSAGEKFKMFISGLFGDGTGSETLDTKLGVRSALADAIEKIKAGDEDARETLPEILEAAKELGIGHPSEKNTNAIIVHKDTEGGYRFVGWLSGKWIDREKEILSDESHIEFKTFLETNPEWQIEFRSWHVPGSGRANPIDFWTYENGFVIVSGKLTEPEAVRLMKAMQKQKIGMSHGFFGVREETDSRIIRKYRTFEVSDLPLDHAAFPWSDLSTLMEAKSMKTQLQYLSETVGEDRLKVILEDTELKAQLLESTGIEEKAVTAFLAGEEIVDEEPKEETKETEKEETPELSEDMVTLLKSALGLEGIDLAEIKERLEKSATDAALLPVLMKQIESLTQLIAEDKKSADEQLAEMLSGKINGRDKVEKARATNKDDNEPDEELKKTMPTHENSWLAEQAGVEPVKS